MQQVKKIANGGSEVSKKNRRIVTWSQQEDDILREQIHTHGTENWAIIASKFKDKTTRQCRRRWYTYLNSDFKKGGWSPEEDLLLCEAQKIFGNRWTEIAKVVSGRTDNAVKNRFNTLCKKRARHEALAKENASYINLNNKRVIFRNAPFADGLSETGVPLKKIRRHHISNTTENCKHGERQEGDKTNPQLRPPLAVLVQNFDILRDLPTQNHADTKEVTKDVASNNITQGIYLKKDDPKIIALLQQAELLSTLSLKVNTEKTDQSLDNAWKILQDSLNESKEGDMIRLRISDVEFRLENSKDLSEDLRSTEEGNQPSWSQSELCPESPDTSEYGTGSTLLTHVAGDKTACSEVVRATPQVTRDELQPTHITHSNGHGDFEEKILSCASTNRRREILKSDSLSPCDDLKNDDRAVCAFSCTEFNSPFQVTPMFGPLASGIPGPQFSESEKRFLLRTVGVESTKELQPPACKRALLQSL